MSGSRKRLVFYVPGDVEVEIDTKNKKLIVKRVLIDVNDWGESALEYNIPREIAKEIERSYRTEIPELLKWDWK